ncbi:MAG TPA: TlpA disulfide reductase family protein [Acidimicrobiales bacterium]|nr:TlpA disulfide reductase family protein [Acidimicrobiales bacterium]
MPVRRRRRLLSLAVGVVIAAGLWLALTSFTGAPPTTVHPFSLPRLGGGPPVRVPLTGVGAHDPVVVTFFASWCGPCHKDLPTIAQVARQARASGDKVRFVGVDDNDAPASGLAFSKSSGVDFPVGRDALSLVAPTFDIPGNPATVFIDGNGRIADTVIGPVTASALEAEIAQIDQT